MADFGQYRQDESLPCTHCIDYHHLCTKTSIHTVDVTLIYDSRFQQKYFYITSDFSQRNLWCLNHAMCHIVIFKNVLYTKKVGTVTLQIRILCTHFTQIQIKTVDMQTLYTPICSCAIVTIGRLSMSSLEAGGEPGLSH